jgi:hypothetical protein
MASHALVAPILRDARESPATFKRSAAAAGIAAMLGVWLAPATALACPFCATRSGGSVGQSVALGVFLLLPFVVAGVVYSVLRSEAK